LPSRSYTPALACRRLTPLYDGALELVGFGAAFKRHVAVLLEVQPHEAVLDLGCGTGTLLAALVDSRPEGTYTGVDPDPAVLAIARRRLASRTARLQLAQAYAQELPFADRAFDAVVSTLVFHHLPDEVKRQTLVEVRRTLRPEGRFLLVDLGRPRSAVGRALFRVGSLFDGGANTRANRAGELPAMLTAAGFAVTEAATPYRGVRYLLARPPLEPLPARRSPPRAEQGPRG
jgi:ubiquinone/menaquinone biosynthesis C-methylase UbiE